MAPTKNNNIHKMRKKTKKIFIHLMTNEHKHELQLN